MSGHLAAARCYSLDLEDHKVYHIVYSLLQCSRNSELCEFLPLQCILLAANMIRPNILYPICNLLSNKVRVHRLQAKAVRNVVLINFHYWLCLFQAMIIGWFLRSGSKNGVSSVISHPVVIFAPIEVEIGCRPSHMQFSRTIILHVGGGGGGCLALYYLSLVTPSTRCSTPDIIREPVVGDFMHFVAGHVSSYVSLRSPCFKVSVIDVPYRACRTPFSLQRNAAVTAAMLFDIPVTNATRYTTIQKGSQRRGRAM